MLISVEVDMAVGLSDESRVDEETFRWQLTLYHATTPWCIGGMTEEAQIYPAVSWSYDA
jgi:hypothetical protein